MAEISRQIAQAKVNRAKAEAALAEAELKAARAKAAVVQAELEMLEAVQASQSAWQTEAPKVLSMASVCGPAPAVSVSTDSDRKKPLSWLAGKTASPGGPAASSSFTAGPTPGTSFSRAISTSSRAGHSASGTNDNLGQFIQFGTRIRLRFWFICRGGGEGHECNSFSMDPNWTVDWSGPKKECCRSECQAKYKSHYGMILEFIIDEKIFLVRSESFDWYPAETFKKVNKLAERPCLSASQVQEFLDKIEQPKTFDQVFRKVSSWEVKQGCSPDDSYTMKDGRIYHAMPMWQWHTIGAIVKYSV